MRKKERGGLDIRLIVYDFDGVFTDNRVLLMEDGTEGVIVNRSDGLAVEMMRKMGIRQVILTTETNRVVRARGRKLKVEVISGVKDKKKKLADYCRCLSIPLDKVAYIGNDMNDYEAMKIVGYPVASRDAHRSVKKIAKVVTAKKGGEGVAREFMDIILKKRKY